MSTINAFVDTSEATGYDVSGFAEPLLDRLPDTRSVQAAAVETSVLAIIPARRGSERMPGKNMQGLHGKPLLWHTIEFALNHPLVTDIIVTSDSTGILDSARQCRRSSRRDGFYTVRRPNHLALGQDGSMKATVGHALDQFRTMSGWCRREDSVANSVPPFLVVLLQPTSPFRDGVALSKALMRVKRGDFENAVSVTRPHALVPAGPAPPPRGRYRYDLDGNFWIFWGLDGLPLSRSLSNDKTYFHEEGLPYSIQIDTASDLRVAQDLRELRL